jgi:hypothetical protein
MSWISVLRKALVEQRLEHNARLARIPDGIVTLPREERERAMKDKEDKLIASATATARMYDWAKASNTK